MIIEYNLDFPCPVCKKTSLKYSTELIEIPYFKEALLTTMQCTNCRYKNSEIMITAQDKPVEYKIHISTKEDLDVHVVRSSSAEIEVPELGIEIHPGSFGESFISNIEGIFKRIQAVVEQVERSTADNSKQKRARQILDRLSMIKKGKFEATVIIRDPLGNSFIASEKAEKRELTQGEVELLEMGNYKD